MSKVKFKVGDRVVISKKYKDRYNCITCAGTVTYVDDLYSKEDCRGFHPVLIEEINENNLDEVAHKYIYPENNRKMYEVEWDDKAFRKYYYSYELDKYEEPKKEKHMSTAKFKVGDVVKVNRGSSKGSVGEVIDISKHSTGQSTRLWYRVKFFDNHQESIYTSYELDSILPKFKIGDQVTLTQAAIDWLEARNVKSLNYKDTYTIDKANFRNNQYTYDLKKSDGNLINDYYFNEEDIVLNNTKVASKKDKPIVMVEFRPQDSVEEHVYKVGDVVKFTQTAINWFAATMFNYKDEYTEGVYKVKDLVFESTTGRPAYILQALAGSSIPVNGYRFFNEDLYKVEAPTHKIGDQVYLTNDTLINLIHDNTYVVGGIYRRFTIEGFYYVDAKVVYKLDGITGLYFFENELKETEKNYILNNVWSNVCDSYLYEFCKRHGYVYEPDAWVGSDPGTTICVCDMFVSMDDIRYDVDNDIDPEWFSEWYWKGLDVYELTGEHYMNYPSFCKGAPDPWTKERIDSIRESKKRIEEAKKSLEEEIERYKKDKNNF